jgi:hypothetical protein
MTNPNPNPTTMTTNEQRIAIAEACGWTEISLRVMLGLPPNTFDDGTEHCLKHLPDYLNDLNACHEMEQVLTYEQKEQFVFWVNHIHPSADIHHSDAQKDFRLEVFSLVHSPASQRSEAFLRTLRLWKPTPT